VPTSEAEVTKPTARELLDDVMRSTVYSKSRELAARVEAVLALIDTMSPAISHPAALRTAHAIMRLLNSEDI
jgi:hypothetical protein